jgi:hypothetical protein
MYLFTLLPEGGNKSSFQMCYFLDTEQEINFRSQVIISGYLNVHTEHAQIFLACSIICIYIYGVQTGSRKVLGFCSIPLQRRLIKKKIHLFNNKLM